MEQVHAAQAKALLQRTSKKSTDKKEPFFHLRVEGKSLTHRTDANTQGLARINDTHFIETSIAGNSTEDGKLFVWRMRQQGGKKALDVRMVQEVAFPAGWTLRGLTLSPSNWSEIAVITLPQRADNATATEPPIAELVTVPLPPAHPVVTSNAPLSAQVTQGISKGPWGLTHFGRYVLLTNRSESIHVLDAETLQYLQRFNVSTCDKEIAWHIGKIPPGVSGLQLDAIDAIPGDGLTGRVIVAVRETSWLLTLNVARTTTGEAPLAFSCRELMTTEPDFKCCVAGVMFAGRLRRQEANLPVIVTGQKWRAFYKVRSKSGEGVSTVKAYMAPLLRGVDEGDATAGGQFSSVLGVLSFLCGVAYVFCWTVCFYPQVILNHQRKSVEGYSLDLNFYNVVGYSAYSLYTVSSFFLETRYALPSAVEPHDVFFACHSMAATMLIEMQIQSLHRGGQIHSRTCLLLCFLMFAGLVFQSLLAFGGVMPWVDLTPLTQGREKVAWQTYSVVTYLGLVKAGITVIKYIPQVKLNFTRRSTHGMAIQHIQLDLCGGLFSMLQNVLDALHYGDSSFVFGNIPKMAVSLASIFWCCVILCQHYVCYGQRQRRYVALKEDKGMLQEMQPRGRGRDRQGTTGGIALPSRTQSGEGDGGGSEDDGLDDDDIDDTRRHKGVVEFTIE